GPRGPPATFAAGKRPNCHLRFPGISPFRSTPLRHALLFSENDARASTHARARTEAGSRRHAESRRPVRDRAAGLPVLRPGARRKAAQARSGLNRWEGDHGFPSALNPVRGRVQLLDAGQSALRGDGRSGDRAQLELLRVVRGRARRLPRAVCRRLPPAARPRARGAGARDARPLPEAGGVRRPPARPRPLPRRAGGAVPLRVRNRAPRRVARRRLDGARNGRCGHLQADAGPAVARRGDRQCGGLGTLSAGVVVTVVVVAAGGFFAVLAFGFGFALGFGGPTRITFGSAV